MIAGTLRESSRFTQTLLKLLFSSVKTNIYPNNYKRSGDALIEVVNTVHIVKSLGPEDIIDLVVYLGFKNLLATVQVN